MVNKVDFGPVRRGLLAKGIDRGTVDTLEALFRQQLDTATTTEGQTTDLTAVIAAAAAAQAAADAAQERADASPLFERPLDFTGLQPSGDTIITGGTPGGTAGQVQFNDAGAFGGFTISGDGTLDTATGIITVTKLNSVSPGSFFSGTDAANLTGTLNASRIASSSITLAKVANIADQTILGNNTGGAAAPVALTAAQTRTVLSLVASATTDTTNAANISSGVLGSSRGGAGAVSGILKANGSGAVSAAVSGTDYAKPPSIGTSAPSSPVAGDLWWKSDEGRLKVYYTDVDTSQWVDANPAIPGPQGATGSTGATGATGATGPTGGDLFRVSEVVTSSSQASVTFSSITSAYRDLEIRVRGRGTTSATEVTVQLQFNTDTASNYNSESLAIFSTGAPAGSQTVAGSQITCGTIAASTAPTGAAGNQVINVLDYKGTTFNKTTNHMGGVTKANSTGNLIAWTGYGEWKSTTAINAIKVFLSAGNFVDGSVVSLYGRN